MKNRTYTKQKTGSSPRTMKGHDQQQSATRCRCKSDKSVSNGHLELMRMNCNYFAGVEPQGLAATYWFDAPEVGESKSVTVRFQGDLVSCAEHGNTSCPSEHFDVIEAVDTPPGIGRVAVTAHIESLRAGLWEVSASLAPTPLQSKVPHLIAEPAEVQPSSASGSGSTTFWPVAATLAPGAHLGVWPTFVSLGALIALVTQALAAHVLKLPVMSVFAVSLVAGLGGLICAKTYYGIERFLQGERSLRKLLGGACIQGFIIGVLAVLVIGAAIYNLQLRGLLGATAPALLFGMALGRWGCFFGGCCAGRPTASRLGIWSSDRRIGIRRVPVQLLESGLALMLGFIAFLALLYAKKVSPGLVFVGALSSYTLGRQLLFPFRAQRRNTGRGRIITLATSAAVLISALGLALPAL